MLTARQNFLETIRRDGQPDRLVNQYEATRAFRGDPLSGYVQGNRFRGMEPLKDLWGVTFVWPQEEHFPMPSITPQTKVLPDITCWRDYVHVPDLAAECDNAEFWQPYLEQTRTLDRKKGLLTVAATAGVFERLHFLMGFEDTLCNLLMEPEAMEDLIAAVTEYRLAGFRLIVKYLHPEVVISQDDWGSKTSLFMSPDTWRELIRPAYEKIYGYLKSEGVIIIHHSDSICEPIAEDMAEVGIDVWQGVLPQNDIPALQKKLDGRLTLMGGIDAAVVDRAGVSEAEVRAEVRRACECYGDAGHFIPCITYGGPSTLYPEVYPIITDEIDRYNREHYGTEE